MDRVRRQAADHDRSEGAVVGVAAGDRLLAARIRALPAAVGRVEVDRPRGLDAESRGAELRTVVIDAWQWDSNPARLSRLQGPEIRVPDFPCCKVSDRPLGLA